ncbi:MAG: VanZ family protein [Actinomycetota bacterium]
MITYILWFLTVGWAGVIFFFSSLPGSSVPSAVPDYIPHFVEFLIFAGLVSAALWATKKELPAGNLSLWAIIITGLYAASDELHQAFIPGRTPDIKDWAVDVLAAAVVAVVVYVVRARR